MSYQPLAIQEDDYVIPVDEDDYGCETCGHRSHPSGPCQCGCDD